MPVTTKLKWNMNLKRIVWSEMLSICCLLSTIYSNGLICRYEFPQHFIIEEVNNPTEPHHIVEI